MARSDEVTIENCSIVFRNFAGKEGTYNREGDRSFAILLEPGTAELLESQGWNVKTLKPREDEEVGKPYLTVSVSYRVRAPRIVLMTSRGRTTLTEEMVEMLDFVEIESADVVLNPYHWSQPRGDHGIKAYLKTMYIKIVEDPLDLKYAEDPV